MTSGVECFNVHRNYAECFFVCLVLVLVYFILDWSIPLSLLESSFPSKARIRPNLAGPFSAAGLSCVLLPLRKCSVITGEGQGTHADNTPIWFFLGDSIKDVFSWRGTFGRGENSGLLKST